MEDESVPLRAAGRWHRDVDRRAGCRQEVPQRGGVPVAQHRARAARLHRREPSPFEREPSVPHRVHAAVEHDEPAGSYPVADLITAGTEGMQLGRTQHSMVEIGGRRDSDVD
jgi:hypothetical protein